MDGTEITVQVFADLDTIMGTLQGLGYTKVREYRLNDWYFTSLPHGDKVAYPTLLKNSILVRQVIDDIEKVQLCYKDKTMDRDGNVIDETKTTVQLSSLDDTLKILRQANLPEWCDLQQTLYVYQKGQTEFAVQVVDGLGIFIEYEADDRMANLTAAQKMASMYAELKKLHLPLGDDLSCKKVYLKYCHQ